MQATGDSWNVRGFLTFLRAGTDEHWSYKIGGGGARIGGEKGEEHHHNQLPREWLQDKPSFGSETRRCSQRRRGECFKMPRNQGRRSDAGGEGSGVQEHGSRTPVPELYLRLASPALARHELQPGFLGCRGHAEKCRQ
ncbi:unnamed protein product [Rangifer tarandus platyrhynchus]|uniref:Uncharacterized protein n=1 Tax=Rangifer tarandus platyrhynchus TaxID=3082113 RepID=A0AC59ZPL5_RANTA